MVRAGLHWQVLCDHCDAEKHILALEPPLPQANRLICTRTRARADAHTLTHARTRARGRINRGEADGPSAIELGVLPGYSRGYSDVAPWIASADS